MASSDITAMLETLRQQAEKNGPAWLRDQLGGISDSQGGAGTSSSRPQRRCRPPVRLSREASGKQRRTVSPSPRTPGSSSMGTGVNDSPEQGSCQGIWTAQRGKGAFQERDTDTSRAPRQDTGPRRLGGAPSARLERQEQANSLPGSDSDSSQDRTTRRSWLPSRPSNNTTEQGNARDETAGVSLPADRIAEAGRPDQRPETSQAVTGGEYTALPLIQSQRVVLAQSGTGGAQGLLLGLWETGKGGTPTLALVQGASSSRMEGQMTVIPGNPAPIEGMEQPGF
ncbi:hypothetical protein XELAEV_18035160mg [Xenopus laevis]|uniref:Uncharacterized protein n=1 Tax=Xenopus laevis TaxID=8355 RepID=A0A974CF88_XENLA|nr:hypothetical protein XELAEV_18035160mg [Xenopus laevis]